MLTFQLRSRNVWAGLVVEDKLGGVGARLHLRLWPLARPPAPVVGERVGPPPRARGGRPEWAGDSAVSVHSEHSVEVGVAGDVGAQRGHSRAVCAPERLLVLEDVAMLLVEHKALETLGAPGTDEEDDAIKALIWTHDIFTAALRALQHSSQTET